MLKEKETVKTEIDIFLSLCLKFDMQKIRISFVHIKSTSRSSCSQMFFQKVVLQNFSIFTTKHLCWSCRTEDLYLYWKETPKLMFFLWLLGNSRKIFYSISPLAASVHWMGEFSIFYFINLKFNVTTMFIFYGR